MRRLYLSFLIFMGLCGSAFAQAQAQGTWTPGLFASTSGSWSASTATGYYKRIDNLVILTFYYTSNTANSPVGNIQIYNLPAAAGTLSGATDQGYCSILYTNGFTNTASYTFFSGIIAPNSQFIALQENGSGVASQPAAAARASVPITIAGSCIYHS